MPLLQHFNAVQRINQITLFNCSFQITHLFHAYIINCLASIFLFPQVKGFEPTSVELHRPCLTFVTALHQLSYRASYFYRSEDFSNLQFTRIQLAPVFFSTKGIFLLTMNWDFQRSEEKRQQILLFETRNRLIIHF